MATNSSRRRIPRLSIALFTLSCAISACEGAGPHPPDAILDSAAARGQGALLYAAHCAICHGKDGGGTGPRHSFMVPAPADLTLPPWSQRSGAARTFLAIRTGVRGTAMTPWPTLSERQTWELVAYIESLGRSR